MEDPPEDYSPPALPPPDHVAGWLAKVDALPRAARETDAARVYKAAYALERLTYEDVGPLAQMLAYRTTRMWLYLTGRLALDEPLTSKTIDWSEPSPRPTAHLRPADRINYATALLTLEQHSPPLMPTTAQNGTLAKWSQVTAAIALDLEIDKPSKAFPHAGGKVIRAMTSPQGALRLWPSPKELLQLEENIALDIFEHIRDEGRLGGALHARDVYGVTFAEARAWVTLALDVQHSLFRATPDHERSLSIARAEETVRRARTALDRRGEIIANKHVAIVVGLARAEIDDANSDFVAMASKVMAPPQIPQRPPPLVVEAAPSKPAD